MLVLEDYTIDFATGEIKKRTWLEKIKSWFRLKDNGVFKQSEVWYKQQHRRSIDRTTERDRSSDKQQRRKRLDSKRDDK